MKGIILDLDDTLYPHEQYMQSGMAAVAAYVDVVHGVPAGDTMATMKRARLGEARGRELQALCEAHRLDSALVPALLNVFRVHQPVIRLRPGAVAAVGALKADGWRVAILTNGLPAVQRAKVSALGLLPLVHHVIYAEEHAPGGKPHPAAFAEALARLDVPAARCVHVGDDPVCDIAGARGAGIAAMQFAPPGGTKTVSAEASLVLAAIEDLPEAASSLLERSTTHAA